MSQWGNTISSRAWLVAKLVLGKSLLGEKDDVEALVDKFQHESFSLPSKLAYSSRWMAILRLC